MGTETPDDRDRNTCCALEGWGDGGSVRSGDKEELETGRRKRKKVEQTRDIWVKRQVVRCKKMRWGKGM